MIDPFPADRLVAGLPFARYKADLAVNAGLLSEVSRSPLHGREYLDGPPRRATPDMRLGKFFHAALLEPLLFVSQAKVFEGPRTSRAYKALLAAQGGDDEWIISASELATVRAMLDRVHDHPVARGYLEGAVREISVKWTDAKTGLTCKGRPDAISKSGLVIDIKTCLDAGPDAASRELKARHIHLQAAQYLAFGQQTGLYDGHTFCMVFIERQPPYAVAVYTLGAYELAWGTYERNAAMAAWAEALKTGRFAGYPDERVLEAKAWALPEDLRRQRFEEERARQ